MVLEREEQYVYVEEDLDEDTPLGALTVPEDSAAWIEKPIQDFAPLLAALLNEGDFTDQALDRIVQLWTSDREAYRFLFVYCVPGEYGHVNLFGGITDKLKKSGQMTQDQEEMIWQAFDRERVR